MYTQSEDERIKAAMSDIDKQREHLKVIRAHTRLNLPIPNKPNPPNKTKPMDSLAAFIALAVGGVSILLASLTLATIINGYVLHLLWLWFMVPILGLPALTIGQAIAVSMVVSFLTYQYVPNPKETKDNEWASVIGIVFIRPLFVLLLAQIVRNFI